MNVRRRANKLLKEIQSASDAQYNAFLSRINSDSASREAMEYLAAKGVVKVSRAMGGDIVFFHLLPQSTAYLQDQKDRTREKWADRLIGFIAGVASSVLTYFLIQAIQASIK